MFETRWVATTCRDAGIRPHQEGVALWSGSGASWSYAGGDAFTRELAGGGSKMYRILTDYASASDSNAPVQRFDGSSWDTIGSFGNLRQVHATGPNVDVLDGAHAVHVLGRPGWTRIDDAPFVAVNRLFGSYGHLFGMTSNGTVHAYESGAWTSRH